MNTTAREPNVTSTIPASTPSSSTTITSTLSTTTSTTSSPTSTLAPGEVVDDLKIILPCAIIGGLILIVGIAILCYMIRRRLKQRKQSPPILPSFTVPDFNDSPIQSDSDPLPVPPSKPIVPSSKPIVPSSKPIVPSSKPSICDKPVLETRESVASVTSSHSDGYFFPCAPPKKEIQDDPEYIDMTQQQSLPKPCGVANKGYVNDPKNPQTNIFTIHEISSHYQNTGNYVPDMKPMETVHEYANVKNEIHEPISDIIYENTIEPLDDDHQLIDYENAPAKLSPSNVNTNENITTNNLITQIKQKPLPSPRTNPPKTSPRGSPHSKSSPRGAPLSKSSPRTKPEKYRGVKVM